VIEAIVARFGSLHKILRATIEDLNDVEGVGTRRARAVKEGLSRITETSIFERYG
jgi:diadenylate cyclase